MHRIDIQSIVHSRGIHLPRPIIRYLEHIVHQREMNDILHRYESLTGYAFMAAVIEHELQCSIDIRGTEHLANADGSLVFVSNHPLGGPDGLMIALALHRLGFDTRIIVNDLLLQVEPLKTMFVPVNKIGQQSHAHLQQMQALWESRQHILSFPAGACSRLQQGQIRDLEWKPSFVKQTIRYQRTIVPIYFNGQNSNRFYQLALWRKRLGIKANIEMLYLVDEMFRARGKHFEMEIKQPLSYTCLDSSKTLYEWAQVIKSSVYEGHH